MRQPNPEPYAYTSQVAMKMRAARHGPAAYDDNRYERHSAMAALEITPPWNIKYHPELVIMGVSG